MLGFACGECVRRASGNDVTVTVLAVKHGQVRIGVTAPQNIPVHREEIYARIATQRLSASPRHIAAATIEA